MKTTDIGSRLELMVDDHLIERLHGDAVLHMHQPVAREIVFPETTDPVVTEEGNGLRAGHLYHTVLFDDGTYRMYYGVTRDYYDKERSKRWAFYAESTDGRDWTTPSLKLFECDGSRDNSIVWTDDLAPFIDENPDCAAAQRYKAISPGKGQGRRALYALSSAEGLRWERMSPEPVITDGAFDSQNLAFWDSVRGEYRAYWRDFFQDAAGTRYRGIKTAVSQDFLNWTAGQWLYYPGAEIDELYTNQIIPYYRAPQIFVGFPSRYVYRELSPAVESLPELTRRKSIIERTGVERIGTALTDTLFISSRDGVSFKVADHAFIRPGLRPKDNWIYGDNYTNWGIVETPSDVDGAPPELSFYVSEGSRRNHFSKECRRYTLRIDGFGSLRASRHGGEVITRPLTFTGNQLVLNFSAAAAGSVRVELQNLHGLPIPGFSLDDCVEIIGDDLERRVGWKDKTNLGDLSGRPLRIRFRIVEADVFSIRFI